MAVTHIVTFKWHDSEFDAGPIASALHALASGFDGVQSYRCGPDAGLTPGAYDFAVVGTFDDHERLRAYQADPEHQRILTDMIMPNLAVRTVVQWQD